MDVGEVRVEAGLRGGHPARTSDLGLDCSLPIVTRSTYRTIIVSLFVSRTSNTYNCIPWCFCPNTLRIPCIAITKTRVVRHVCLYPQLRSGLLRVEINDDYFSSTMGDRTRTISSAANLHKRRRPGLFRVKLPIYIIKRTQE